VVGRAAVGESISLFVGKMNTILFLHFMSERKLQDNEHFSVGDVYFITDAGAHTISCCC